MTRASHVMWCNSEREWANRFSLWQRPPDRPAKSTGNRLSWLVRGGRRGGKSIDRPRWAAPAPSVERVRKPSFPTQSVSPLPLCNVKTFPVYLGNSFCLLPLLFYYHPSLIPPLTIPLVLGSFWLAWECCWPVYLQQRCNAPLALELFLEDCLCCLGATGGHDQAVMDTQARCLMVPL